MGEIIQPRYLSLAEKMQAYGQIGDILEALEIPNPFLSESETRNIVHGPVLGPSSVDMINSLHEQAFNGPLDPREASMALGGLIKIFNKAEELYAANRDGQRPQGWPNDPEFRTILAQHHGNLAVGQIALLPEEYWTTRREGHELASVANAVLGYQLRPPAVNALAIANYSTTFSPATMGNGYELQRTEMEALDTTDPHQMPHLKVTNLWIKQRISEMLGRGPVPGLNHLTIMDLGSGTGPTLAASIGALKETGEKGDALKDVDISVVSIESNPGFYDFLKGFSADASEDLRASGHNIVEVDSPSGVEPGSFNLFNSDMVTTLDKLGPLGNDPNGNLLIVTSNYAFHRIPNTDKAKILNNLSRLSPNVVILMGDLRQNASRVNRGYFNMSPNGPLNPGNTRLTTEMKAAGYTVTSTELPADNGIIFQGVNSRLANALENETSNDGFVWLACKGPMAGELVFG